jgi:hypothetical protein
MSAIFTLLYALSSPPTSIRPMVGPSLQSSCSFLRVCSLFKGGSPWYFTCGYTVFNQMSPLYYSLPLSPPLITQQLSVHSVVTPSCPDAMYFDAVYFLSFSFPLPPPSNPIKQPHYCKQDIYISCFICVNVYFLDLSSHI